jgi:hypothetical protein
MDEVNKEAYITNLRFFQFSCGDRIRIQNIKSIYYFTYTTHSL